jgi:hypothetical protein
MDTEAYSKRMAVAVRRELRQADGARYYQVRGGPGLTLAQAEATARQQRQQTNYPPQAA